MAKMRDLKGQRFGRLVVCRREPPKRGARNGVYWICKCDCGRGTKVLSSALLSGLTQSCGCLRREKSKENARNMIAVKNKRREMLTDKTDNT